MTKRLVWSERARASVESGPSGFSQRASLETRTVSRLAPLLEAVAAEHTDLVLIDTATPDLPAREACLSLRSDPRTAAVPILLIGGEEDDAESFRECGCREVIPRRTDPRVLQEKIAVALGIRLRRHPRFPIVLPVARGRLFHEFLGYSHSVSEGGMGFDTIVRIRGGDHLDLQVYRTTEEKPMRIDGRVCGVRPNIDTGVGYSVGVEFVRMATDDRRRLADLFPSDACVTWGTDLPEPEPDSARSARGD